MKAGKPVHGYSGATVRSEVYKGITKARVRVEVDWQMDQVVQTTKALMVQDLLELLPESNV